MVEAVQLFPYLLIPPVSHKDVLVLFKQRFSIFLSVFGTLLSSAV